MLPVNDQWTAVFAAPLPFFLALVAVAAAIWGAMLWRYKGVYEKQTELYDLLNKKAELQAHFAAEAQNELKKTVASRSEQIEDLQKPGVDFPAAFARLEQTSSTATEQLQTAATANNAVSATLSNSRRLISWPPAAPMSPLGSPGPLRSHELSSTPPRHQGTPQRRARPVNS